MKKFEVGDKALLDGKKVIITEVSTIVGKKGYVYKIDDSVVCYADYLFKEYISPHQELLDLGWKLEVEAEEGLKYSKDNMETILTISKIIKRYWVNCQGTFSFALPLAKILVRYLEELE